MSGISVSSTGPFAETGNCGTSLPAGRSCSLSLVFSPNVTGTQNGVLTVSSANVGAFTVQMTGVGIAYDLVPVSSTSVSVTSGHTASYSLQLVPVSGSAGSAMLSCSNLPPDSTCSLNPAVATLSAPSNIQVAIATGVAGSSVRVRRADLSGPLPWPFGLLLMLVPLGIVRCRSKILRDRLNRLLMLLVVIAIVANITACGKGIGPLNANDPLPTTPLTPSGTYTVTVTAAAGGLEKSVSLTLQVQ